MTFEYDNLSDNLKQKIHDGIRAGIEDVEAGRVMEFNQAFVNDLKASLRTSVASYKTKTLQEANKGS